MNKKYEFAVPHQDAVPNDRQRKAFRDINEQFKIISDDFAGLSAQVGTSSTTATAGTVAPVQPSLQPVTQPVGQSGGNAAADRSYVTINSEASLPNSRQLAAGTGLTLTDAGAGLTATLALNGKAQRFTTGSIGASTTTDVTCTWTVAFANANYTVTCGIVEATANLEILAMKSISASQVVVTIRNNDGGGAHTGDIHLIAVHD